jgi:hypothetical protein
MARVGPATHGRDRHTQPARGVRDAELEAPLAGSQEVSSHVHTFGGPSPDFDSRPGARRALHSFLLSKLPVPSGSRSAYPNPKRRRS